MKIWWKNTCLDLKLYIFIVSIHCIIVFPLNSEFNRFIYGIETNPVIFFSVDNNILFYIFHIITNILSTEYFQGLWKVISCIKNKIIKDTEDNRMYIINRRKQSLNCKTTLPNEFIFGGFDDRLFADKYCIACKNSNIDVKLA